MVGLFGRRRSPIRTLAAALIALGVLGYRLLTRTPETSTVGFWVAVAVTAVLLAVVARAVILSLRSRAADDACKRCHRPLAERVLDCSPLWPAPRAESREA
ncbi:MAG: hypothetical protein OEO20_07915 [Gemmatimonadota bacterium]|nr:hypothetical protein [Gemmatimonadota bacterium]MDH3478215.1 hypothetical protein [Gemmatimonadota bacterium]MDH3568678.1 hypothetical protein [Gemmatimonadota bacterium]MDH5549012.1 hypothetical protein [Gemmatimonadota bacterium]